MDKYGEYDAYIYKIVHKPTNLFYVGVTTQWLMDRWWQHIKAQTNSKFHKFIREHDITEFTFEILETFNPRENDPFLIEDKWIKKFFNTWNECKNFLLAEGFINLNQFSSTSERFHYLQKIDEIMLYAM